MSALGTTLMTVTINILSKTQEKQLLGNILEFLLLDTITNTF